MSEPQPEHEPAQEPDPDREAILKRRQRFIAAALTGLASLSSGCPEPQPCLNVAQPERPQPEPSASETPQVCLRVAAPDPTPAASDPEPEGSPAPAEDDPPAPR